MFFYRFIIKFFNFLIYYILNFIFSIHINNYITDDTINDIIATDIKVALDKTTEILIKQKLLLLKLSEYLTKHTKISSNKIKNLVKLYANDFDYKLLSMNKEHFYYDLLKKELNNIG